MPNCDGADRAVISSGFEMIEFPFPNHRITKSSLRNGNPRSSPARSCSRSPASSETRNGSAYPEPEPGPSVLHVRARASLQSQQRAAGPVAERRSAGWEPNPHPSRQRAICMPLAALFEWAAEWHRLCFHSRRRRSQPLTPIINESREGTSTAWSPTNPQHRASQHYR
jgi:hypothetical protein